MAEDQGEIVKWYTLARRFPQLIGKTPDGTKIPGGPYTFTQVFAAAGFLVVAWKTVGVWGRFGLVGNFAVLAVATWVLLVVLGRIPIGLRNPLSMLEGALHAVTATPAGRVGDRPVRIRRPRRVRTVLTVHQPILPAATPAVAATPAAVPATPVPAPAPSHAPPARPGVPLPLTGVQRLLAGSTPKDA